MKKVSLATKSKNLVLSTTTELEAKAVAKLNAGQYKEAIEHYKTLFKQTQQPYWQEQLAFCYLQRALNLANKNMLKEAIVMWDNYALNAKPPHQKIDCYIVWQLQNTNHTKVISCLRQLSKQHIDEHYTELAILLGLLMLNEHKSIADALPQDCQLLAHLRLAMAALEAYRANDTETTEAILTKIPFRSAFRDFRTLMKAVILLPVSIAQANLLLHKIPATSPYHKTALMLLDLSYQGAKWVIEVLALDTKQRKLLMTMKGLSKKQEELLNYLAQQKNLTEKVKFTVALKYQDLIGSELSKSFCQSALANYPGGQSDFNKVFKLTDTFEAKRIKALKADSAGDTHTAEDHWLDAIELLKNNHPLNNDDALKIALIYQRIANYYENEDAVSWYQESLDYDPENREIYLNIIRIYENQGFKSDAFKEWLEKCLEKFPDDLDFLLLAIKNALFKKAFKKAAHYAESVLKIDPVNTYAKQTLFRCYIAHSRKLLTGNKFHLIEAELQKTQVLVLGKRYQELADLIRGFWVYVSQDQQQGLTFINAALNKLDESKINQQLIAMIEALLLKLPTAPFLSAVPKKYVLAEPEITRFIGWVQHYVVEDDRKYTTLHKALTTMTTSLKASIKEQSFSEETFLAISQCFDNIKHFELLLHTATIANKKWKNPIWIYYKIYAKAKGDPKKCNQSDIWSLRDYLQEQNHDAGDRKAISLIKQFIDRYYQSHNFTGGMNILESLFDEPDMDDRNPIADLFPNIPMPIVKKIEKRMTVLSSNTAVMEKIVESILKIIPKNMDPLMLLMQHPDLMPVFIFMKAAEELEIETNVTLEQIKAYFALDKATSKPRSPFPFF